MAARILARMMVIFILAISVNLAQAQQANDSTAKPAKYYKNVVRYNLSGPLLFGFDYIVFGYERVINNRQTMSMNFGQASLPKVVDFTSGDAALTGNSNNTGYNFSLDYRFYLQKENKYKPPRGVYIGPYYSYNHFNRESEWKLSQSGGSTDANTTSTFSIHTIGAELGYQFVLGKRITLDFVLAGPGYANYKLNSVLTGDLTAEQKQKVLDAVQALLNEKFPGMDYVLSDASIDAKGNLNTWSLGYRYIIHVGFRF